MHTDVTGAVRRHARKMGVFLAVAIVTASLASLLMHTGASRAASPSETSMGTTFVNGQLWLSLIGDRYTNQIEVFKSTDTTSGTTNIGFFDHTGRRILPAAGCRQAYFNPSNPSSPSPNGVVCPWTYPGIVVHGNDGDDAIVVDSSRVWPGGAKPTILYGDAGADALTGGPADDQLYGAGDSSVDTEPDVLDGAAGNDLLRGGDNLGLDASGRGGDILYGRAGIDTLDGGPGDGDVLDGGSEPDILNGGSGNADRVTYVGRKESVTIRMDAVAGAFDDGGSLDDMSGNRDEINADDVEIVQGGDADDRIYPSTHVTALVGGPGNDYMVSVAGSQTFEGSARGTDDTVSYGDPWRGALRSQPVTVTLAKGADDGAVGENDRLAHIQHVVGGTGTDFLVGTVHEDVLEGGPGNDTLDGGYGADILDGGADYDTVTYGARKTRAPLDITLGTAPYSGSGGPAASITGEANDGGTRDRDIIRGTRTYYYDNVTSTVENVVGGLGADNIEGNDQENTLIGGDGADTIGGGNGHDKLEGGLGVDWLVTNDDEAHQTADDVDCGAPDPPDTRFDENTAKPRFEDWADVDEADAETTYHCENIAEPPPSDDAFDICEPDRPTDPACEELF